MPTQLAGRKHPAPIRQRREQTTKTYGIVSASFIEETAAVDHEPVESRQCGSPGIALAWSHFQDITQSDRSTSGSHCVNHNPD